MQDVRLNKWEMIVGLFLHFALSVDVRQADAANEHICPGSYKWCLLLHQYRICELENMWRADLYGFILSWAALLLISCLQISSITRQCSFLAVRAL